MTPILPPERVRVLLGTNLTRRQRLIRDVLPATPKPPFVRIANLGPAAKVKLTPKQRAKIREAHNRGEKCELIARRYGISVAYVSMIGTGARRVG